jgi:hypothetical protein
VITFVLTSCGRFAELENTLESFFKYNTSKIDRYIIIEDSGCEIMKSACIELNAKYDNIFEFIFNKDRIGQIKSIDEAYSLITTEYIFHCEDDWEFYRTGFIEDSMAILEANDKIINIWLRSLSDTNGHPVSQEVYEDASVQYRLLDTNWRERWCGFSFNPGLRRLKEYSMLKPYSDIKPAFPAGTQKFYTPESEIGIKYRNMGYYAAILTHSAVRHTGWGKQIK